MPNDGVPLVLLIGVIGASLLQLFNARLCVALHAVPPEVLTERCLLLCCLVPCSCGEHGCRLNRYKHKHCGSMHGNMEVVMVQLDADKSSSAMIICLRPGVAELLEYLHCGDACQQAL